MNEAGGTKRRQEGAQGGWGGGIFLAIGSRSSLKTLAALDTVPKASIARFAWSAAFEFAMLDNSRPARRGRSSCTHDGRPADTPTAHDEATWLGFLDAAGKQGTPSRLAAKLASARAGRLGRALCSALAGSPVCTDRAQAAARLLAPSGRRDLGVLYVRSSPCQ
jgi:hypothetical protein